MKIEKHRLTDTAYHQAADVGREITPEIILIHHTAGGHASGSIHWLTKKDDSFLSAHLVIARDGTITQTLPFNLRGSHAGVSVWRGKKWCNSFSIGIEIANWGFLRELPDGRLAAWPRSRDHIVPKANAMEATHKYGKPTGWWETYPDVQVKAVARVCHLLMNEYPSLVDAVGHDDVSPGRKLDPGPAWPWARFKALVAGKLEDEADAVEDSWDSFGPEIDQAERDVSDAMARLKAQYINRSRV